MPPKIYDHPPINPVIVRVINHNAIEAYCGQQDEKIILACYAPVSNKIFIRDDLTVEAFKKVLRHEYGHVNGWDHD